MEILVRCVVNVRQRIVHGLQSAHHGRKTVVRSDNLRVNWRQAALRGLLSAFVRHYGGPWQGHPRGVPVAS